MGFNVSATATTGLYRGGDDDDADEMSVSLVEETGAPGGHHPLMLIIGETKQNKSYFTKSVLINLFDLYNSGLLQLLNGRRPYLKITYTLQGAVEWTCFLNRLKRSHITSEKRSIWNHIKSDTFVN